MNYKMILLLIVSGVVITLLTALYSQDMTVGLGASITGYGLPWAWLKEVTIVVPGSPNEFSLNESGLYLILDIIVWTIVAAAAYLVYKQLKK